MTAAARTAERWRPPPFGVLGDERLAQRAGAGDERAFAIVYQRYHHILYRYCRSILNNDADAQDALQSTFGAAFTALQAGQRDAPMRPWLFRIAHNESVSILRRRRPALELSQASEQATSSIEDEVAERAALSVLMTDLHELTDRQRSALVLRELSGLSHQEIAIALGSTVGAAKQTIFEARQSLFEFAEGRAMACDEIRKTISDADGRSLRSRRVRAHLRECGGCAAFAAAIPARTGELRALAPAFPGIAAVGLLGRVAASAAGRGGNAGLARLAAGAAAKTASASAGFGANALAGVAVVATATVGVTVGVGRIVQAMHHPETLRGAVHAPASPTANAADAGGSLLGSATGPRARAGVTPYGTAAGARRAASHHTVIGGRWARGVTGSRTVLIDRSIVGKGPLSGATAGQAGPAHSGAAEESWRGAPAPGRSDQSSAPGASASAAGGNPESTHGNSAGSSAAAAHGGSGNANQGGSGSATHGSGKPAWAGSGKPSWANSGQSAPGNASSHGPDGSAGTSPVGVAVNAPPSVAASVNATAGSATAAVGTATSAVSSVTSTAVGSVTSAAAGTVTSTVADLLSGKYRHELAPDFRPARA